MKLPELDGTALQGVAIVMCSDGHGHFFRENAGRPVCGALVDVADELDPPERDDAAFICSACVLPFMPS